MKCISIIAVLAVAGCSGSARVAAQADARAKAGRASVDRGGDAASARAKTAPTIVFPTYPGPDTAVIGVRPPWWGPPHGTMIWNAIRRSTGWGAPEQYYAFVTVDVNGQAMGFAAVAGGMAMPIPPVTVKDGMRTRQASVLPPGQRAYTTFDGSPQGYNVVVHCYAPTPKGELVRIGGSERRYNVTPRHLILGELDCQGPVAVN